MRRDLTQPILNLDGEAIPHPTKEKPAVYTMTDVVLSALMTVYEDEKSLTGKDKAERMALALKINKRPKEVDLTVEQMALLKLLIGKAFGPLVVGRAYELLEQEPKAAESAA